MERLKTERRWCIWKYIERDGKQTKVPFVNETTLGKSDNPKTWLSFNEAEALRDKADGIGVYLSTREDDDTVALCGIDIDAHQTEGENPATQEVLELFNGTYAERSPSGNGIHILCDVQLDRVLDKDKQFPYKMKNSEYELEIYIGGVTKRYLTFTGDQVSLGDKITDQTEQVLQFLERYMKKSGVNLKASKSSLSQTSLEGIDFSEVPFEEIKGRLDQIRQSPEDGAIFKRRYDDGSIVVQVKNEDGETIEKEDHSTADFVLCMILAKWFNGNLAQMDTAFRHSKLMREKWNERRGKVTYGQMTMINAVDYWHSQVATEEQDAEEISKNGSLYPKTWDISSIRWLLNNYEPQEFRQRGTYAWLTSFCEGSIGLFDQYASLFRQVAIEKGAPLDLVNSHIEYFREELFHCKERNLVLRQIQDVANDGKEYSKVSVCCFPCGAGKSTAISYLIRETIERNDWQGLLIVTDRKDRFDEYMHFDSDRDPELSLFLEKHQDEMVAMTSENYSEAYAKQRYSPVLMMTTQRYFAFDPIELSEFFHWDKGMRTLVVFDEECPLSEAVEVNINTFNMVDSALQMAVMDGTEDKDWCVKQWQSLRTEYERIAEKYEALCEGKCNIFHQAQRENLTDDDNRFFAFIKENKPKLVSKNDEAIRSIRAVRQLLTSWGVCTCQKNSANKYYKSFHVYLDNRQHVRYEGLKFIILDGTGQISPVYQEDYVKVDEFKEHLRSLNNLTINLVDMSTNRDTLSNASTEELKKNLDIIYDYIRELPDIGDDPTIFTYMKGAEPYFKRRFEEERERTGRNRGQTEHFGNTKGSNRFKDVGCIIQIGLNRFREGYYLAFALGHNEVKRRELSLLPVEETIAELRSYSEDQTIKHLTSQFLLVDIEQNMYRGLIRKPILTENMIFYILFRLNLNRALVQMIHDRFDDDELFHQAKIKEYATPLVIDIWKIRERKTANNEPDNAQKLVHLLFGGVLDPKKVYSSNDLIELGQMTRAGYDSVLKRHPAIREYLRRHEVKRGQYQFHIANQ